MGKLFPTLKKTNMVEPAAFCPALYTTPVGLFEEDEFEKSGDPDSSQDEFDHFREAFDRLFLIKDGMTAAEVERSNQLLANLEYTLNAQGDFLQTEPKKFTENPLGTCSQPRHQKRKLIDAFGNVGMDSSCIELNRFSDGS